MTFGLIASKNFGQS